MKKPTIQEAIYLLAGLLVAVLAVYIWSIIKVSNQYLDTILENGYIAGVAENSRETHLFVRKNAKQMECTTSTTGGWWLQVQ